MSASEIIHVFECFGLATQEQRDIVLSQANMPEFKPSQVVRFKTWISNSTESIDGGGGSNAKLENTP